MLLLAPLTCNGLGIRLLTRRMQVVGDAFKDDSNCLALGVIAATMAAWAIFDHSVGKATVLLLGMLFGGSLYFVMKAQG